MMQYNFNKLKKNTKHYTFEFHHFAYVIEPVYFNFEICKNQTPQVGC